MALERTAVFATARQLGLSRVVTAFALLLLLALATLFVSSAHAGWAGPVASQQFSSLEMVDADVIGVEMVGVHRGQIDPAGSLPCPGAADACCSIACGAFAHVTEAPSAPCLTASARMAPPRSLAVETGWRSAAFRPPIS